MIDKDLQAPSGKEKGSIKTKVAASIAGAALLATGATTLLRSGSESAPAPRPTPIESSEKPEAEPVINPSPDNADNPQDEVEGGGFRMTKPEETPDPKGVEIEPKQEESNQNTDGGGFIMTKPSN